MEIRGGGRGMLLLGVREVLAVLRGYVRCPELRECECLCIVRKSRLIIRERGWCALPSPRYIVLRGSDALSKKPKVVVVAVNEDPKFNSRSTLLE